MSVVKFTKVSQLMKEYSLQIEEEQIPASLTCVHCKSLAKDAYQGVCGCRMCNECLTELVGSKNVFCTGCDEDCGESLLYEFVMDYNANKSIGKLTVKCPYSGCLYKGQLARMEMHLQKCSKKVESNFGCVLETLDPTEATGECQAETSGPGPNDNDMEKQIEKLSEEMLEMKTDILAFNFNLRILSHAVEKAEERKISFEEDLTSQLKTLSTKVDLEIGARTESHKTTAALVTGLITDLSSMKDELKLIRDSLDKASLP